MKISNSPLSRPLALSAAAMTLALVACSTPEQPATAPVPAATTSSSTPPVEPSPASPSESASATTSPSASATASPAAKAASNSALVAAGRLSLKEVSAGTVASIESEGNGWEVHVVTASGAEKQLRINAAGKRVTSGPVDDPADAEDRAENKQFAKIKTDYRDAVKAIEGEIEGGKINELSLDSDVGRTLWEADVSNGSEQRSVQVNANNGKIVSNQLDD